jgi:hypothetical protein
LSQAFQAMLQFAQGFGVERSKAADVPKAERHRQDQRKKEPETPLPHVPKNRDADDPGQVQNAPDAVKDPDTAQGHRRDALPEEREGLEQRQSAKHARSDQRGAFGWELALDLVR